MQSCITGLTSTDNRTIFFLQILHSACFAYGQGAFEMMRSAGVASWVQIRNEQLQNCVPPRLCNQLLGISKGSVLQLCVSTENITTFPTKKWYSAYLSLAGGVLLR